MSDFWMIFYNCDKGIKLHIGDPFDEDECTREDIESCLAQMQHGDCYLSLEYISEEGNQRLDLTSENSLYHIYFFRVMGIVTLIFILIVLESKSISELIMYIMMSFVMISTLSKKCFDNLLRIKPFRGLSLIFNY